MSSSGIVRVYYNPWARLIFLGPALMALGGLISLLDRRLRVGAGSRAKKAAKLVEPVEAQA